MKRTDIVAEALRRLHVPASPELGQRVYAEIGKSPTLAPTPHPVWQIFTTFLKKKSIVYTFATSLGLLSIALLVLNHSTSSAWAMEQAIEALKKYKALHITGYVMTARGNTPVDVWARSDATGNLVERGLARFGELTVWTSDNKSYTYDSAHNTALVEPGITFGLNPWFGPKLLARLARMKDYKAFEGEDPATGQKRVIVTCSIEIPTGPHSFLMEFDVRTKLLVSMKSWRNLKQEGAPNCYFEKILYFEDLPDSVFNFQPPADTPISDMPLTIPETSLRSLSDPNSGISADGMTREEACQKILAQLWAARNKNDFAAIRQLWPVSAGYSDEMLSLTEAEDEVVQLLKIGGIERSGQSELGPLALVPSWIRQQDGSVRKIWTIVQFREADQGTSCVVFGAHGYALNVTE